MEIIIDQAFFTDPTVIAFILVFIILAYLVIK